MPFLYAFAAALVATSAPAPPAAADAQAIVVEGTRDPRRRADDYLDKVVPAVMDLQIGRFEDPLCPRIIGLPDELRDQVLGRLAMVAEAANIPVNPNKCEANLLIMVVDDKKALIEGMRHKKEAYLYGVGLDAIKRMENDRRPVAAWQISDVVGADGMPLIRDGDGFPRLFTTVPMSRIASSTRKRLLGAIVVLEQRGLVGVTTRQLADYALLRLLSPIQARERAAPASSVLSLFNDGVRPADAPPSLSWLDLALLKAIADTRGDINADIQRTEIRDRIVKEMAKIRDERESPSP